MVPYCLTCYHWNIKVKACCWTRALSGAGHSWHTTACCWWVDMSRLLQWRVSGLCESKPSAKWAPWGWWWWVGHTPMPWAQQTAVVMRGAGTGLARWWYEEQRCGRVGRWGMAGAGRGGQVQIWEWLSQVGEHRHLHAQSIRRWGLGQQTAPAAWHNLSSKHHCFLKQLLQSIYWYQTNWVTKQLSN